MNNLCAALKLRDYHAREATTPHVHTHDETLLFIVFHSENFFPSDISRHVCSVGRFPPKDYSRVCLTFKFEFGTFPGVVFSASLDSSSSS